MFKTNEDHGFFITFENGYTISVQWGTGTYSENNTKITVSPSKTAEVAILDATGTVIDFEDEFGVIGYCTPEQVVFYIMKTQQMEG